jgi:hypothetical protein
MSLYRFVLVVAIAALVASFVPVAHADQILKTDAKSKIQLKSEAPKIPGDLKKSLKGIAKVDKTLKNDPTGLPKEMVKKSLKFDFKPKTRLGDLKLKSLTKTGKFDLKKIPAEIFKTLELKYLIKDDQGRTSKQKTANFYVPLLLGLDVTNSRLISGFSLDWLTNGSPVLSDPATGLSFLGLSARTVPEPSTLLLLASGLLGLTIMTRKRTARSELA